MRIQFLGSGDAFGSGGRFNTCFHLTGDQTNILIDCGASSLIAMKRLGIDRNDIDAIIFTHFHADHFGGLPFVILDAQFFTKRTRPLTLIGPPGLEDRFVRGMETAFPGSSRTTPKFPLRLQAMEAEQTLDLGDVFIRTFQVNQGNPGGPYFAYRIEAEGRSVAYTGDTEWTSRLIDAAKGVDLFVAEAYFFDKSVPLHLDLRTLEAHLPEIQPKRLILTHMSEDMLSRCGELNYETAADGLTVEI